MPSVEPTLKRLLYKVARAYYEDGLNQGEIGDRYGLSRIKVSRLLRQARELKIVQISLTPMDDRRTDLEQQIEAQYGIPEAVTVTPDAYDQEGIARAIGPAGAECLVRSIHERESVAITWGRTLVAVVDSLPFENWPEVRIVQSLGALAGPDAPVNGIDLTRRMAQIFSAQPLLLSAPGIVDNKAVRNALLETRQVSEVLEAAAQVDLAVVGIGVLSPGSVLVEHNVLSAEDRARLQAKGSVGDIGLNFFDAEGNAIDDEIHDRVIGLTLTDLRHIPRVIGVSGGETKVEAIRAALRGKLIDVLVTDDCTAARLLEKASE